MNQIDGMTVLKGFGHLEKISRCFFLFQRAVFDSVFERSILAKLHYKEYKIGIFISFIVLDDMSMINFAHNIDFTIHGLYSFFVVALFLDLLDCVNLVSVFDTPGF